jgi:hypothetical protein
VRVLQQLGDDAPTRQLAHPTGKIDRVTLKKLAAGDHAYHT